MAAYFMTPNRRFQPYEHLESGGREHLDGNKNKSAFTPLNFGQKKNKINQLAQVYQVITVLPSESRGVPFPSS